MANQLWGVRCPLCSAKTYLKDEKEGICSGCGAPIGYLDAPAPAKKTKPKRRLVGQELEEGEVQVLKA